MTPDLDTLQRFFASAPFMVDLGVLPTSVSEGVVHTELKVTERHRQHTGRVHGGVIASLADHTMGAAAQTMAADGFIVITAELSTSLLRAAEGGTLVCEGRVLKPGRAITFTEAEVFAQRGSERVLVAKASATMALVAVATQ